MDKTENTILLNFLKNGLSTRQLDNLLNQKDTDGWISWKILKKYKLTKSDKCRLFLYSNSQCNEIITKLAKEKKSGYMDELLKSYNPDKIKKYLNTFVIADSENSFHKIMSGETRNIIQDFFDNKKKSIGKCQFEKCSSQDHLDTVHLIKDRPQIFID